MMQDLPLLMLYNNIYILYIIINYIYNIYFLERMFFIHIGEGHHDILLLFYVYIYIYGIWYIYGIYIWYMVYRCDIYYIYYI